jgi:hypothetical protein
VLVFSSILNDATTGVGLMAATIAVGGFLAHAPSVLRGDDEGSVRLATVFGGLIGFAAACLVLVGERILW